MQGERRPGPVAGPVERLREALLAAASSLATQAGATEGGGRAGAEAAKAAQITLERPRREEFGDYSSNAALILAPALGLPTREAAAALGEELAGLLGGDLTRFEVAGPGFLNLFVSDRWLLGAVAAALAAGEGFAAGEGGEPERILVEFVSANPTGPMHIGHARNAAYGDALARLLELQGHHVEREFYVNDTGTQIRKLGESIAALARGQEPPEDGYRGEYVTRLAGQIESADSRPPEELGRAAVVLMVEEIDRALQDFRVSPFHRWFYESSLHEGHPSALERTLERLAERGETFQREGALWLRTTDFGDDKDRVLVRSTGEHTYFAPDIAYHQDKRERGFERQIDVWGADHHGYVGRMKAAYEALGGDPAELELLTMQLVHLMRGGERAQMSKRAGEFVTLEDLVGEIGVDATRWYLLARSHDTTVDLDLDLAREQSSENPVYYVQYAHARIASILASASGERVGDALAEVLDEAFHEGPGAPGLHPSERALVKQLLAMPGELREAADRRAPHRVAAFVLELAQRFTAFYRDCRVLEVEPRAQESLRIAISEATRRGIARCLGVLGVSAPEKM